jgi:hypothetical protein
MARLKLKKLPKKPKSRTKKTMESYLRRKTEVEKHNKELLELEKKFNKA